MGDENLTCGDNSCIFGILREKRGMGTNGGCRCFDPLDAWIESEKRWNRHEVAVVRRKAMAVVSKARAATERAEKAERERDEAEARAERLAGLLAEAGSVLLGNAAVLHRHVLTTGSERFNRTANRARDVAAKIDAALKDTP